MPKTSMIDNHHIPLVSVVITTKNEEKNICNCLESIKLQTWQNIEIIVVDNNSNDETRSLAKIYTEKIYILGPERSAQRNYGMLNIAVGQYVIYIDADMILSPLLIESCVKHIRDTEAVALHIPEIVLGKNFFSNVRRYERNFYDGTPVDGARFFIRDSFVKIGGFDAALFVKGSGEDWDIDKSIKQLGCISLVERFSPNKTVSQWPLAEFIEKRGIKYNSSYAGLYHNEADFSLINYLKKKSYYSMGFDGYIKKWGKDDPDIRCQFGIHYRFWKVFTENGKWKMLIRHPLLACGMYFLRVAVGIVYMSRS